jgi:hypothetical protein
MDEHQAEYYADFLPGYHPHCDELPFDPVKHARGDTPGLYPDGLVQGFKRKGGYNKTCPEKWHNPGNYHAGHGGCFIIGGAVFIEQVFAIPGMGRLTVNAMLGHDYPIIQGNVVLFSTVVLLSNLLVDLCYGWLDPRVRYR